jgi:hypothetical protein
MKKLPLCLLDHDLSGIGSHNATTALSILESVEGSSVWANINCGLEHPRALKVFTHSNSHSACAYKGQGSRFQQSIDVLVKTLRAN